MTRSKDPCPPLIRPAGVVQFARAVDADPYEKIVFLEETTPVVVQQRTVGLHRIFERHARFSVLFLQLDCAAVKVDSHQGGFPSLPGNGHLRAAVGCDELPDVVFQHFV